MAAMHRHRILALALAAAVLGLTAVAGRADDAPPPVPVKTGKERLGDKASDEQRVDNCKVPPERRGPKPRPDDCNHLRGAALTN
jgi:hypothetical protein